MSDAPSPLADGERLGRLVITGRLGSGGMGVVYQAHDPELDRDVAVKVLRPEGGELASLRLVREAQTLAQLSHPNVVAVHDVGIARGQMYVAMELIDGETLDAYLRRARPGWRAVVALFVQAGRGLAAAHARQIVHRDFKPGNVLVDRDGRVRVTDFGLARSIDPDREGAEPPGAPAELAPTAMATTVDDRGSDRGAAAPAPSTPRGMLDVAITEAGTILGTPRYMAPEQRTYGTATARSDQYAFCVALWEALEGGVPAQPPVRRRMPRWLARALGRGLAIAPAERHDSMNALLAIVEGTPVRRRRIAVAIGGLAIAGAAAAIALGFARSRGSAIDCARAGDDAAAVWNDGVRAKLVAAFAKARPYGAAVAGRIGGGLDDWTRGWRDARVEACRATHERGAQSDEMLDRIGVCLDAQLDETRALVARLAIADGTAIDRAIDAARALPATTACSAARIAAGPAPAPGEAAARRQFDAALVARRLGDDAAAERGATAAATATTAPAVRAQALALEAVVIARRDADRARALLEDALTESARAGDRDATLYVTALYVKRVAEDGAAQRIEAVLPMLRAAAAAAGPASPHQREAAIAESRALMQLGRFDDSDAVCARIAALEPAPAVNAALCRCRNAGQRGTGDLAPCHEAVELDARAYGADHVLTAAAMLEEANALGHAGKYEDGLALRQRATKIVDASGETGTPVADAHYGLARSYEDLGRPADALAEFERVLAIDLSVHKTPTLNIANDHSAVAEIAAEVGDRAKAREHAAAALAIGEQLLGPDHPDLVPILVDTGTTQHRIGDHEAALAAFLRAIAIADKALAPDSPRGGLARADAAQCLDDLGRPREALPLATRAVAILGAPDGDPHDLAIAHLVLATAAFGTGDRALGRKEAALAHDLYAGFGAGYEADAARAAAMLR